MCKLIVLLSAVACALGAVLPEEGVPRVDGRITGGSSTNIGRFPWQVSLQENGWHMCGGVIYNKNIIITAAHCVKGAKAANLQIRAGSTYWNDGGEVIKVANYKMHGNYNDRSCANDVAVMRLKTPLTFNNKIQPIPLANSSPGNGATAFVSGWGTLTENGNKTPDQLRFVKLDIVSRNKCSSNSYGYGNEIKASMICADAPGKSSCYGDSGGPLVVNDKLVGLVSWSAGCAFAGYPDVYADVAYLRDWIISNAKSV